MRPKMEIKKNDFRQKLEEEGLTRRRAPSPQTDAPELFPDLLWVWEFFNLLNRQRQVGQNGPQPVSLTDILSLTKLRNITRTDDLEFLLYVLPEMDAVVLKDHYDQLEKRLKKDKNKGKAK